MTWRRRLALLLVLLAGILPRMSAQVVQLSGYGSSVNGVSGASLTRYDENATSRLSLGAAQGVHFGVSREVTSGSAHLILGDSHPSLALPSDLQEGDRGVYATGALLQVGTADRHAEVFAGRSGENYGNAFFSGVSGEKTMLLSSATMRTGRIVWNSLIVRGERHAMVASGQWRIRPQTLLALSAGMCAGRPVLRGSFHHAASSWHVDITDTSGHLQLQPQRNLQLSQLERIGLNISASKRVRQWLTVDAARHEYATGIADLPDSPTPSTLGPRSVLLEAGATAHLGEVQSGVRLLGSSSGSAHDHAVVWIEGWRHGPTTAQAMVLRRTDPLGATTTTLQLDAGRSVNRHLQLQTGMQLGNGSPHADVGGTLEGNWGSVSVSHGETYVPFGPQTGFRRVLTVALRLHVRNAEIGLARLSATGIPNAWDGSLTDFESAGDGVSSTHANPRVSLAKYRLEGTVTEGNQPIAGAAVAVGSQLVYTDSAGHWMARFQHNTPVRVAVQPSEFLTVETYRALTEARTQAPAVNVEGLALHVERARAAALPEAVASHDDGPQAAPHRSALRVVGDFALQVVHDWTRKVRA